MLTPYAPVPAAPGQYVGGGSGGAVPAPVPAAPLPGDRHRAPQTRRQGGQMKPGCVRGGRRPPGFPQAEFTPSIAADA